jgi:hypothetical protein
MMRRTAVISSVLLVFSGAVLSGCATSLEPLPRITDPQRATEIVLIRERSSVEVVALSYYFAVNDKAVFRIGSGEYTSFMLPSGTHKISIRCFDIYGGKPAWRETAMEYEFPSLKKVYFLVVPGCVSLKCRHKGTCADIVPISESEAATFLPSSTYRPFSEGK